MAHSHAKIRSASDKQKFDMSHHMTSVVTCVVLGGERMPSGMSQGGEIEKIFVIQVKFTNKCT